jgi:hypothetical protein
MPSITTTTTTTTNTTTPFRSVRTSRRRTFLSLSEAIALTGKLFNPNLKPYRPFRQPTNPSLRASQLPPPCAELDERPRRRIRRFMLWQDKVPPLRLVVLDPRKRGLSQVLPKDELMNRSLETIQRFPDSFQSPVYKGDTDLER